MTFPITQKDHDPDVFVYVETDRGWVGLKTSDGDIDFGNDAQVQCVLLCRRIEALEKRIAQLEKNNG